MSGKQEVRRLITSKEAAKYLCISERTLWQLSKDGKIPIVRVKKRVVRYDIADLGAFIEQQKN